MIYLSVRVNNGITPYTDPRPTVNDIQEEEEEQRKETLVKPGENIPKSHQDDIKIRSRA